MAAILAAQRLAALFPGRFYLELQRTGDPRDAACTQATLALAVQQRLAGRGDASDPVPRTG